MKHILTILLFTFLFQNISFAQSDHKEIVKGKENGTVQKKFLNQTVIIKLKTEADVSIQRFDKDVPALKQSKLKIHTVEKMFPDAESPKEKKNKDGKLLSDLSRTYIITYKAAFPVEEAVQFFVNTGLVEYAEPYYLDEILVIPNDPVAQPGDRQFYLERIKAYEAWNLTQGDSNVVIGIIDTGVRLSHEDLKDNVKYNMAEANGLPGVDDDNDGYIDNITGWDLGNNDNNPDATGNEHGTCVAGISSATTNNGIGLAGTGFKCKYLPVKASSDNLGGTINQGYQGIYYAATHGAKVINLSWGGASVYSQTAQDIINFAAINRDAAIIAAAGNSGKEEAYYPASYENVLSVSACDTIFSPTANRVIDRKADFATFHHRVDLCAQGRRVYIPRNAGDYTIGPGTSFSTPLVAGAAGLVRTLHPHFTAVQVIHQLRVTGDIVDTFPESKQHKEKYGRRLNMLRALTDTLTPSVRMTHSELKNNFGVSGFPGDTVKVYMDFTNYLYPTTNCKLTLSSSSPYIEIIDSTAWLGVINTFGNSNNNSDPFVIRIKDLPSTDFKLSFRIQYDDGNYYDYQHFTTLLNPSFITIDTNEVALTVTSAGRLGYTDNNSSIGDGFVYKGSSLLFEGGLVVALNDTTVSDCVRGEPGFVDKDFSSVENVRFSNPHFSDVKTKNVFADTSLTSAVGVTIEQNSMAWKSAGHNKYVIVEYKIKNTTNKLIDSVFAGLYMDWDIMDAGKNRANWNGSRKLGYVYSLQTGGLYGGVSLLTNEDASYFALDHYNSGGNNINPNDGFPSIEKYTVLKNGVSRPEAGLAATGADVSHIVGAKIKGLLPGMTKKIAFAIIAGDNFADIASSADSAKAKYKSFNVGPVPVYADLNHCTGDTVTFTLAPTNGSQFAFYQNYPAVPVATGASYTLNSISKPDTIFISNRDSIFESAASMVKINFGSNAVADFNMDRNPLDLAQSSTVNFTNWSTGSVSQLWNFGNSKTSSVFSPSHDYNTTGDYIVTLKAYDENGCMSVKIDTLYVTYNIATNVESPLASKISVYPVPATKSVTIKNGLADVTELVVYNVLGQTIFTANHPAQGFETVIDLNNKPEGIYYVRIKTSNETFLKTFLKQ